MSQPFDLALLERARAAVNADHGLDRLGSCDLRLGVKAASAAFLVDFVAFECASVSEVDEDGLRDAEIVIEQDAASWQRYLDGRRMGTAPTLMSLDLDVPDGIVTASDPLQALKFERYHLTLQAFFDTLAGLAGTSAPRHAAV
jgi:hypothetical protein